jgi:hypothetical protein
MNLLQKLFGQSSKPSAPRVARPTVASTPSKKTADTALVARLERAISNAQQAGDSAREARARKLLKAELMRVKAK